MPSPIRFTIDQRLVLEFTARLGSVPRAAQWLQSQLFCEDASRGSRNTHFLCFNFV
ncbi:MAG: hypothetical protein ACON4U_19095 [Myxococcota bacterium]